MSWRPTAHPRSRGENVIAGFVAIHTPGSSPLTRGKPHLGAHLEVRLRLIPAHAGKTEVAATFAANHRAHPRSRGENSPEACRCVVSRGSSPLTRGKLTPHKLLHGLTGLIPAHAGKTSTAFSMAITGRAHPRSRGENLLMPAHMPSMKGSSPLTRGKHLDDVACHGSSRLIPAHAGKTRTRRRIRRRMTAHPRSRGENVMAVQSACAPAGSSPLTRGKRDRYRTRPLWNGLIPAHAGKTRTSRGRRRRLPAHPRSRGENHAASTAALKASGSSPLTRGKPSVATSHYLLPGLIPAHAGKTGRSRGPRQSTGAHPRSRGENISALVAGLVYFGSSPLTRGKPIHGDSLHLVTGLIPAHAGKTRRMGTPAAASWAHPRSRGENVWMPVQTAWIPGSSPLTRGKRRGRRSSRPSRRLIPAHAGKTSSLARNPRAAAAHPRSRGENIVPYWPPRRRTGSSPLTRGKPEAARARGLCLGLIPAHAGKTNSRPRRNLRRAAHPRSRGENRSGVRRRRLRGGSSPLTRGKPSPASSSASPGRLIPAHAGKTKTPRCRPSRRAAHPRSRGENADQVPCCTVIVGSSPLTRGKPRVEIQRSGGQGLIPAHAGKTTACQFFSRIADGSSPLTRGKPLTGVGGPPAPGLIPAHAGKTSDRLGGHQDGRAHPRSRGENSVRRVHREAAPGSSPLTRGKRERQERVRRRRRLIPAHAGKTTTKKRSTPIKTAHPRSRGENRQPPASSPPMQGSSPLTRGKRPAPCGRNRSGRLIPAHAGKTTGIQSPVLKRRAHPRSRGENH